MECRNGAATHTLPCWSYVQDDLRGPPLRLPEERRVRAIRLLPDIMAYSPSWQGRG